MLEIVLLLVLERSEFEHDDEHEENFGCGCRGAKSPGFRLLLAGPDRTFSDPVASRTGIS